MKKYFLFSFFSFFSFIYMHGQNQDLNETLKVLDKTLEYRNQYMQLKEEHINLIKKQAGTTKSAKEQYFFNKQIINEYITYSCDSAILYIEKNKNIADQLNNRNYKYESLLTLAKAYAYAGLFSESYQILEKINSNELPKDLQWEYYSAYFRFYDTLIKYTNNDKYSSKYKQEVIAYLDSTQSLLSSGSTDKNIEGIYKDFLEGKYELVINDLLKQIPSIDSRSHLYAIATSSLAYAYMAQDKKPELQRLYLAKAAIKDARLAIKDHSALLNLAILLHTDLDSDRAYKYMRIALDDANFYNSRHRNSAIIKIFPIIEKTYLNKIEEQKRNLTYYLLLVSILAAGLLFTSLYIYKQVRIAVKVRRNLKLLNERLDEANHIKEEYIGYFLNQCSVYVNKFDEYKQFIYRKIKSGQMDDLMKSVSVTANRKKEIEELYTNFDIAFLKLYPGFVEDFNKLLKQEEQYKVKSNKLNTELRIFALIRLGITDNKQISSFLRYSIQTIYNYRSRVKSKALNEGDNFEEKVKNIGILQQK